ncbi:MAG: DotU family type IV/VI secretion system protein [Planctomycetes bacterium]|nr:DotU family type IV/VI secretion system protein [Planctomycetota bacterium]
MSRAVDRATSLADLCAGAFAFVVELQAGPGDGAAPLQFEPMARRARELLAGIDSAGREHGFPKDATDHAKYAVGALIDEVVLASRSSVREEWLRRPLMPELFSEFNAGEEFFRRIEQLSRGARLDPWTLGALEVYATCLSLGFRGMHIDQSGAERLRETLLGLARRINEGRENTPLAPHWQPDASVAKSVGSLPPMVLIGAGLAAVLLLYGLFELLMWWDAGQLGRQLKDASPR